MIRLLVPKGDCDRNKEGQTRRSRGKDRRRQSSVDVPGNENGSNRHFGGWFLCLRLSDWRKFAVKGKVKLKEALQDWRGLKGKCKGNQAKGSECWVMAGQLFS